MMKGTPSDEEVVMEKEKEKDAQKKDGKRMIAVMIEGG